MSLLHADFSLMHSCYEILMTKIKKKRGQNMLIKNH